MRFVENRNKVRREDKGLGLALTYCMICLLRPHPHWSSNTRGASAQIQKLKWETRVKEADLKRKERINNKRKRRATEEVTVKYLPSPSPNGLVRLREKASRSNWCQVRDFIPNQGRGIKHTQDRQKSQSHLFDGDSSPAADAVGSCLQTFLVLVCVACLPRLWTK